MVGGRSADTKEGITTYKSLPRMLTNTHSPTQPETGAHSRPIEVATNKPKIWYKAVQRTIDKNFEKRIEQVAGSTTPHVQGEH